MKKTGEKNSETFLLGIDTGGTFTDIVYIRPHEKPPKPQILKVPSTPQNPAEAIHKGLQILKDEPRPQQNILLLHGSTVATNAILERRGAKVALITTKGFGDLLYLARQTRPQLYQLNSRRPPPLVPRKDIFEVSERMLADGTVQTPLDLKQLNELCETICRHSYEAIAVCLLHAYANHRHEIMIANALGRSFRKNLLEGYREPTVSLSSQVLPQFREYERLSTTVLNAYVSPLMNFYINHLDKTFSTWPDIKTASPTLHRKIAMMRSDGGRFPLYQAANQPLQTIYSGPAGGVLGARYLAQNAGYHKIITFDMGGTSTDVAIIPDEILYSQENEINSYPLRLPTMDIHTVGAGGGSIVKTDSAGALQVGPESAGADPGPLCYGKGKKITITDCHLLLHRLDSEAFMGGNFSLNTQAASTEISNQAKKMAVTPFEFCEAALQLAELTMEKAIRVISVERGYDPREFTLVSFGGAGGLHAVELAKRLLIPRVFIPPHAGGLSAYGMLFSDLLYSKTQTLLKSTHSQTETTLKKHFEPLISELSHFIRDEEVPLQDTVQQLTLEMRYIGQSYEISVPFRGDFEYNFHQLHQLSFGYSDSKKPTEIVNIRYQIKGRQQKPKIACLTEKPIQQKTHTPTKKTLAFYQGKKVNLSVFPREELKPGHIWQGPALVTEYSTTTFMPPDCYGRIDPWGNLIIELKSAP